MPRVERFDGTAEEWEASVRASAGSTHCHRWGWKTLIERAFGHECLYFGARDKDGALAGVLPLVRVKSVVFGHYLVSMPFLNYGGPLGEADAVRALVAHAAMLADQEHAKLLELRNREEAEVPLPASHRKITVVLDLPPANPDALFRGFDAKLRSQVRKPQKEGVTVRFGLDQVEPFFAVFSRHMRDLGTPTLPRRFFAALAETFPEDVWFGCGYAGGRPVAGGCGFRWGSEFEMTWASSLREFSRMAPNMLLYWSFIERAIAEGLSLFNFGRCTPGSGTHRFKRQWGSRDVPLWWYQYSRDAAAATPSPDDGAYSWGPRLWKRLPLPIASALGPRIVRYIP